MARLIFTPAPAPGVRTIRIDTAPDVDSPAAVTSANGAPYPGGLLRLTDPTQPPRIFGPDGVATLYQKSMDEYGNTAGPPLTLHGADQSAPAPIGDYAFVTTCTYSGGNLTSVVEDGVRTSYAYNSDGTVHSDARAGITRIYSYDGAGNITGVSI